MHSDIREFWEQGGIYHIDKFELSTKSPNPLDANFYWTIIETHYIMAMTLNNGDNLYNWEGTWYSEAEMLRIVELKVFL